MVLDDHKFTGPAGAAGRAIEGLADKALSLGKTVMPGLGSAMSNPAVAISALMVGVIALGSAMSYLAGVITALIPLLTSVATGFSSLFLLIAAKGFLEAHGEVERYRLGLEALVGGAKNAVIVFAHLRELARLPGINLDQAMAGFNSLFASFVPATLAIQALTEFANAAALAGKSSESMGNIINALTQIAGKGLGGISGIAEEINQQLSEHVPQIKAAILQAFGTLDFDEISKSGITGVEFIRKIVEELKKLPRAGDGWANLMENMASAGKLAFASIGDAIAKHVMPMVKELVGFVEYLAQSGILAEIGKSFATLFSAGTGKDNPITSLLATMIAVIEKLPEIVKGVGAFLSDFFEKIGKAIGATFDFMKKALSGIGKFVESIVNGVINVMNKMIDLYTRMNIFGGPDLDTIAPYKAADGGLDAMLGSWAAFPKLFDKGKADGQALSDSITGRRDDILAGFAGYKPEKPGAIPSVLDENRAPAVKGVLDDIAESARETARNTRPDYKRHILGGGDLGRLGVTPNERGHMGRSIKRGAAERLVELITEIIGEQGVRMAT